mmetsp:Transcript_12410/g.14443  ORF Transcript_12410/g.14443 Transcript_12410/m.14443 type:complete len:401 (+) Transcript_12410:99-1301(+)
MPQKLNGYNQVFCKGRFISGPDARSSILSVFMIFVPSLLWQIFVGSFFANQYSVLIPILGFMLQVSSLYLLLATALSDPGIMPRQKDFTEHYDERSKVWRTREPQRFYDVLLRGHPLKLKYCKTCNIYRPPRCTHCSVCENCVERFDHHCPWLGNCIGKRNYRLFYGFVSTTGALNILVLATAVAQLAIRASEIAEEMQIGGGDAFGQALLREAMAAILSIYALGIVWFTFGLCAYHNWLVCTNQTTYEQIKGAFSGTVNPFHRGILGNYWDILCTPVRPRYFNAHFNSLLWPPKGAVPLEQQMRTKAAARTLPKTESAELSDLRVPEETKAVIPPLPREAPPQQSIRPGSQERYLPAEAVQPVGQEPLPPPTVLEPGAGAAATSPTGVKAKLPTGQDVL